MSQSAALELNKLSSDQLLDIKQQMESEIQHLSESFQKLRQAQAKFQQCQEVTKTVSSNKEDTQILVPLTASLYVPGRLSDVNSFIVDVGTGYYVEKNATNTQSFFQNRIDTLKKNLVDLKTVVDGKVNSLKAIDMALRQRMAQEQQKK